MRTATWIALSLLVACGGSEGDDEPEQLGGPRGEFPSLVCPGAEGCTGSGDGVFRVGAARVAITPDLDAAETEWDDENADGKWESGEAFTDTNDNGIFDAVWMAGFGNGRPAIGVHSDLWVRAIVYEWNDIRVAHAVTDTVGWMVDDIDKTREMLPADLDIDHLIVQSIHCHEAPDTMGLWGRQELVTGLDPDFQLRVQQATVDAVAAAVAALEPATMSISKVQTVNPGGSSWDYVGDGRDPVILDPTMTIMQYESVNRPGESIATVVHWAAHPEYSGDRNNYLTADYVYLLREVVENGIAENTVRGLPAMEGVGGEVIFSQGALGGQIGPKHAQPIGLDGQPISSAGLEKSDALGRNLGRLALETMTNADEVTAIPDPSIEIRTGELDVAVDNTYYHVASLVDVFDRQFHGHDPDQPIGGTNIPYISSRVTYLRVGTVGMITAPGELHPELFVGGYDGSMSFGEPIIDPENPNPPMIENAPPPPYLKDLVLDNPGVEHALLLGLAEDMIGYIVPSWNYQLDENGPYIEEAEGDHYEETNSVGPLVESHVVGSMRQLLEWRPE